MEQSITEIERKILDFMVHYLRTNTYQPSIREIGERFGIKSTKTVSEHLQALADKGFLERDPARSRGVKILGVDLSAQTVSVPCYHELPQDRAGLRTEQAEMHLTLDRRLAGAKGSFFVRATGHFNLLVGVRLANFSVKLLFNFIQEIFNYFPIRRRFDGHVVLCHTHTCQSAFAINHHRTETTNTTVAVRISK